MGSQKIRIPGARARAAGAARAEEEQQGNVVAM